jgi:hypothetical protein
VAAVIVRAVAVAATGLLLAPAATAARPLTVQARLDEPAVAFGSPVRARIVVRLDPSRVVPGSLRIVSDLAPLSTLAETRTTRTEGRNAVVVTLERTAVCLAAACVVAGRDATPALPRARVSVSSRDGRTLRAAAAWPRLRVRGRVAPADLAKTRPPFRADTAPPPPSYAIAPSTLIRLLAVVAALLGLGAAALVAGEVVRATRRRHFVPVDELARAVRLVREAGARPPGDRRRALGLLSRLLVARDPGLAGSASDLAWSRPPPASEQLDSLAGEVERKVAP